MFGHTPRTQTKKRAPLVMPWRGAHVPHAVLEVNQRCNISCTACYKDKSTYTKPFEQIERELDVAVANRRLAVVTVAGGEPTLHPRLPDIIRLVASRGLTPQMLSNGLSLTEESLAVYRAAGLRRIYLHIDSAQRRPDAKGITREPELDGLREEIGARVRRSGIRCALSLTLYRKKNLADLSSVVAFVLDSPSFDRLLVTCYTDVASIASRLAGARGDGRWGHDPDLAGEEVSNDEVARALEENLGMRPYGYIPSDRNEAERRWLLYYSFAIHAPGERARTLHLERGFQRVVRVANAASRALRGTYPFEQHLGPRAAVALCLASAASSLDPATMVDALLFLRNLRRPGASIVQKSFIFQQGPNVTADGALEICRDCPDATVRDGKLVPLCLADVLSPAR